MFALTRHEKIVLLFLAVTCVCGTIFNYLFKKNPELFRQINILENEIYIKKIDVNKASYEELLNIPHIGPVGAKKIIDYRREYGFFDDIEELKAAGLPSKNLERMRPYVFVRKD